MDDYQQGENGVDLLKIIAPELIYSAKKASGNLREQVSMQEESLIVKVLDQSTTIAEAANQLGIPKTTLWRKIQKIKGH